MRKFGVIALLVALVLLLSPHSSNATPAGAADFSAADAFVQKFMDEQRIPGLGLVIVEGNQIVHARGFGVADTSGRAVTAQTPFIIGSNGKSFTALAVLQLVEADKLGLDTPVVQYLPWFRVGNPEMSSRITVRHLLNHTSGFSTIMGDETQSVDDSRSVALEESVRSFSRYSLSHTPGTAYEYSNANYQTAGLVVQTVSGETYEDYIQRHIFTPLEMRNSFTSRTLALANGLAQGYRYWFDFPIPADNLPFPRQYVPAGYLMSSAEDMGHWLILHMNEGRYKNETMLSPQGMAELHRPNLGNYAMGWAVAPGLLSHNGAVPAYGAQMWIDTRQSRGIAILFNVNHSVNGDRLYTLAPNLADILNGRTPSIKPATSKDYVSYTGLFAFLLLADIVWVFWSFRRWRQWSSHPERRPRGVRLILYLIVPLVLEIGVSLVVLQMVQARALIANVLLYAPDMGTLLISFLMLAVGWGTVRTIWGIGMSASHHEKLLQVKSPYSNAEG